MNLQSYYYRAMLMALLVLQVFSVQGQDLLKSRTSSYYTYIFRLTNEEAARIYKADLWIIDSSFFHTVVDSFPTDSQYQALLPPGHYLKTLADKDRQRIWINTVHDFSAYILNNETDLCIQVVDLYGNIIPNARVSVGGKLLEFKKDLQYYVDRKSNRNGLVTIEYNGQQVMYTLERQLNNPLFRRAYRKVAFRSPLKYVWRPVRYVVRLPVDGVKSIKRGYPAGVIYQSKYYFRRFKQKFNKYDRPDKQYRGYLVFNQPVFRQADTVRFKAFIVNRKGKPLNQKVMIALHTGQSRKILGELSPYRKGAYESVFVLHDSLGLKLDRNYTLDLQSKDEDTYLSSSFRYEDYELKNTQLKVRLGQDKHYKGRDLKLFVRGTDINDLNLLDGRVEITLTPGNHLQYFKDYTFIPDTLLSLKRPLSPDGETEIIIPGSVFPEMNLEYTIQVKLLTADNEVRTHQGKVSYYYNKEELNIRPEKDTIHFEYLRNGISEEKAGKIYGWDHFSNKVLLYEGTIPVRLKVNPYYSIYEIGTASLKNTLILEKESPLLSCYSERDGQTLKILVDNPRNLPFNYNIYRLNKEEAAGYTDTLLYTREVRTRQHYYIYLRYLWAGKVREENYKIPLLDKKLNIEVEQPAMVSPGEKVQIEVKVTNSQGDPVKDADLTAYSLTKKFQYAPPALPYMGKARKGKTFINRFKFVNQSGSSSTDRSLDYEQWKVLAGLDTLGYYRFIYPGHSVYSYEYRMSDNITQFAPFVMAKGKPVPVHVIYVDSRPVYFSWSAVPVPYSFQISPGYHQIRLRTTHKDITIDSMYFREGMKKIFSLDTMLRGQQIKASDVRDTLDTFEQQLLHRYTLPLYDPAMGNRAYVQSGNQFYLLNSKYNGRYLIGPVSGSSHFGRFDEFERAFMMEPYYEYTFSPDLIRMKSEPVTSYPKYLSGSKAIPGLRDTVLTYQVAYENWKRGTNVIHRPDVRRYSRWPQYQSEGTGRLYLVNETRRAGLSYILLNDSTGKILRIYAPGTDRMQGLKEGNRYQLLFFYENGYYQAFQHIDVRERGVNRYRMIFSDTLCQDSDSLYIRAVDSIMEQESMRDIPFYQPQAQKVRIIREPQYQHGSNNIAGYVYDETGEPLIGANVLIEGTTMGTVTDLDGYYSLNVPAGYSQLRFTYIGYKSQTREVLAGQELDVYLGEEESSLAEVVVSASRVEERILEAPVSIEVMKLSGITTLETGGIPLQLAEAVIPSGLSDPLWIVNGKVYKGNIRDIDPGSIIKVEVLKEKKDIEMYGPDAKNGVVLITTSAFQDPAQEEEDNLRRLSVRSQFSDYAFWQPKLRTDKAGKARFEVKFPDDITSWQTHYLAMTGKKQSGQVIGEIKAYKSLAAQLALPRFLVAGDIADVVGKALNYQQDPVRLVTEFRVGDISRKYPLRICKSALIDTLMVKAVSDTLSVQYTIEREDGYFDGELRSILVFPAGLEQISGLFEVLDRDTTITVPVDSGKGELSIYARTDALQVISNEIETVYNYRYLCNEQLASKLKALLAKRSIAEYRNEPFKEDKNILNVIKLLDERKKPNGLWGWWKDSEVTYWISVHVLEALIQAGKKGYPVAIDRDKIAMELVWQLEKESYPDKRLDILNILQAIGAQVDYRKYLEPVDTIPDLPFTTRLKIIELKQSVRETYQLQDIDKYKKTTLFGNVYYADADGKGLAIHDNAVQQTIRVYRILKADTAADHSEVLGKIRNYFFEQRSSGKWNNIYISSQIIETILPDLLKGRKTIALPKLQFTGGLDTTLIAFPASLKVNLSEPLKIRKTGDFPVYLTLYQHYWKTDPEVTKNDFEISTTFLGQTNNYLEAGKKVTLQAKVVIHKPAEYIMINVPIPGACSYENKGRQQYFEAHREYFRNEVAIFCERLPRGEYIFNIDLLPRYTGTYTLNPAKIELMYFPVFHANNELKKVEVR